MPHLEPPDREPAPSASARDARIEQLLLTGLDRYFAGELEHAIQVWSRVFFLDRDHARARAYIERARAALAERQREAEARGHRSGAFDTAALFGTGLQAEPARETVTVLRRDFHAAGSAVALAARVEPAVDPAVHPVPERAVTPRPLRRRPTPAMRMAAQGMLILLAAALLFTAGYVVAARDRLAAWWSAPAATESASPAPDVGRDAAPAGRPSGSAAR